MTKLALAAALASLTLVTACGGDSGTEPEAAAPADSGTASGSGTGTDAGTGTDSDTGTDAGSGTESPAATGTDGSGAGGTLVATVGEEGDPDAFVITLTDESGQEVTEIPAGQYEVQVSDLSEIHNFHLEGGSVDESTTVPEVVEETWTVTLEPGDYRYVCDPHPRMVGEFTVV